MKTTYKLLPIAFLIQSCGFHWVQFPTAYNGGDYIEGEQLDLNPNGDFVYTRWQDHYLESAEGSYEIRGNNIRLDAAVYGDSLAVQERIVANDSIRIRLEVWDGRFAKKLCNFTNVRLSLLHKDNLVADVWAEEGTAAFAPDIIFDAWQFTSTGLLLQKKYRRQHPKSNFFYAQFRFGNKQNTHLHFNNTRWQYSPTMIKSRLTIDGKKKKRILGIQTKN